MGGRRTLALALGVAMLALAGQAAPSGDSHDGRLARDRYVAGAGDVICPVGGLGCALFTVEPGETQVVLTVDDDVVANVGADACAFHCNVNRVSFCNQGALAGLNEGDFVTVFIAEVEGPDHCGLANLGAGVKGTVTARFT